MRDTTPKVGSWNLLRTLTAQAGETLQAPTAATFVALAGLPDPYNVPRKVEFTFQGLDDSASGAAPTSVTFSFWRLTTVPDGTNVIDLVNQTTIAHANLLLQAPVIVETGATQFWVQVQFTDGTTPKVAGKVYARALTT